MPTASERRRFDRKLLKLERIAIKKDRDNVKFIEWYIPPQDPATTPVVEAVAHVSTRYLPRPAAGILLEIVDREPIETCHLLEQAPNQICDYRSLMEGMILAIENDVTRLTLFTDSQRAYANVRAKPPFVEPAPFLETVRQQVKHMMKEFPHSVELRWIPQADNVRAVTIANTQEIHQ